MQASAARRVSRWQARMEGWPNRGRQLIGKMAIAGRRLRRQEGLMAGQNGRKTMRASALAEPVQRKDR
jgi:hypothetical protein